MSTATTGDLFDTNLEGLIPELRFSAPIAPFSRMASKRKKPLVWTIHTMADQFKALIKSYKLDAHLKNAGVNCHYGQMTSKVNEWRIRHKPVKEPMPCVGKLGITRDQWVYEAAEADRLWVHWIIDYQRRHPKASFPAHLFPPKLAEKPATLPAAAPQFKPGICMMYCVEGDKCFNNEAEAEAACEASSEVTPFQVRVDEQGRLSVRPGLEDQGAWLPLHPFLPKKLKTFPLTADVNQLERMKTEHAGKLPAEVQAFLELSSKAAEN